MLLLFDPSRSSSTLSTSVTTFEPRPSAAVTNSPLFSTKAEKTIDTFANRFDIIAGTGSSDHDSHRFLLRFRYCVPPRARYSFIHSLCVFAHESSIADTSVSMLHVANSREAFAPIHTRPTLIDVNSPYGHRDGQRTKMKYGRRHPIWSEARGNLPRSNAECNMSIGTGTPETTE